MENIVLELQRDILDREVDIESLLRKAYIIAIKTKSLDFEKWVQWEQNGYDDNIPEYRRIEGKLVGVNSRNEEVEVTFSDRDMEKRFTTIKLPNKISELYALYNEAREGKLAMECTSHNNIELSESYGEEYRFRLEFSKVQLYSIFQSVRNNILKWCLTLMQNKGVEIMTKDAEKLLKYIVNRAQQENVDQVSFSINEVTGIPNLDTSIKKLCQELEHNGMICEFKIYVNNKATISLTTDGLEYFNERKTENKMMDNKNVSFTVHGGQVNIASGNATINATQNNGVSASELDDILKGITESLSKLEKENADEIADIVQMAKEELAKPEPKASRLRNCLTLIAPMFTIANGIPTLATNLQRLQEYISSYIH